MNLQHWLVVGVAALAAGCATPRTVESFAAPEADLPGKAQLFYAGVIGLENLRMTTGAEMRPALRALVDCLLREDPAPPPTM